MPTVRLTITEDPIEVHESELPALQSQGLIAEILDDPTAGKKPGDPGTPPAGGANPKEGA